MVCIAFYCMGLLLNFSRSGGSSSRRLLSITFPLKFGSLMSSKSHLPLSPMAPVYSPAINPESLMYFVGICIGVILRVTVIGIALCNDLLLVNEGGEKIDFH